MPSIVGTWKMIGATARDRDGKPLPPPYGGKGMGRVAFTADGRMMAVTCDARTELPPGTARAYSSYCGNYTFDGTRLVTRVDAASEPARIGSDQVRGVSFDGADRMTLKPPPRPSEAGDEYREISWLRISGE
jgi:lipocalin-like protein